MVEASTVLQGVISLICAYYIFNYEYSPHVDKPLQFLQKYFLKLKEPKVADSVKELSLFLDM